MKCAPGTDTPFKIWVDCNRRPDIDLSPDFLGRLRLVAARCPPGDPEGGT